MRKSKITVVGSINMDLVTKTDKLPKVGETVLGESFLTIPGGKGANQAVAAARLGADVTMIGCVGEDAFGKELKEHLTKEGIQMQYVKEIANSSTGIAAITLSEGDNSIIVVPGANSYVTKEYITEFEQVIYESDVILVQLEIPVETVAHTVKIANKHHVPVILNPAPIQPLTLELVLGVDYLTPNEHEQELLLSSLECSEPEKSQVKEKCIVTKGSKGVQLNQNGEKLIRGFQVETVDSTGAGDTFNGALAVALSQGASLEEACQFANKAAALSVTKLGAQSGMPTLDEVKRFGDSPHQQ